MEVYILITALIFMLISKMNFLRGFRLSVHPIVYFLISVFLFGILGGIFLGKYIKEEKEEVKPKKKMNNKSIVNNGYNNNIFDNRVNQVVIQGQKQNPSSPQTMQYM